MSSESDSILCSKCEFCEEKPIDILKAYWSTKPRNLWWITKLQEKSTYSREDSASGVQVGNIKQVVARNLFKTW